MRKIYFFALFLIIQFSAAQRDTLYLFIEKPFFQYQTIKDIGIGFTLKSKDNRFVCDYYKFGIINYQGWDEKGDDVYLSLKELRKEIDINTISYKTIKDLSLDKTWWEIHNELSLYKKIFLVEKRENSGKIKYDGIIYKYYLLPMIYEGTRKNTVPTNMSKN